MLCLVTLQCLYAVQHYQKLLYQLCLYTAMCQYAVSRHYSVYRHSVVCYQLVYISRTLLCHTLYMFRSFKIYIDEVFKHFIAPKDVLELLSLKVCFLGLHYKAHCRVMKEIIDLLSAEKEEQTWQHMHSGVLYQCTSPRSNLYNSSRQEDRLDYCAES